MTDKKDWTEVSIGSENMWDRESPIEGSLVGIKSDVGSNNSMLYILKTDKGNVSLWGSTVLDTKFEGIAKGTMIRIEPLGLVKSEKTGRSYHDYKVFYREQPFTEVVDEIEDIREYEG